MKALRSLATTLGRGALGVLAEVLAVAALLLVSVTVAFVLIGS